MVPRPLVLVIEGQMPSEGMFLSNWPPPVLSKHGGDLPRDAVADLAQACCLNSAANARTR